MSVCMFTDVHEVQLNTLPNIHDAMEQPRMQAIVDYMRYTEVMFAIYDQLVTLGLAFRNFIRIPANLNSLDT